MGLYGLDKKGSDLSADIRKVHITDDQSSYIDAFAAKSERDRRRFLY